jgi:hypothetical protein
MDDMNFMQMNNLRKKWAEEVGRFVLAFGSIEGITYLTLREFPREPIAKPLIDNNLALKPRLDLLISIAQARAEGDDLWASYAETLKKIKELSSKRNLIAHNGVGIDVFVDGMGNMHILEGISNAKKAKSLEAKLPDTDTVRFAELVAHRKEAERLDKELSTVVFRLISKIGAEQRAESAELKVEN